MTERGGAGGGGGLGGGGLGLGLGGGGGGWGSLGPEGTVPAAFPQTKGGNGEERGGASKRSLSGKILSGRKKKSTNAYAYAEKENEDAGKKKMDAGENVGIRGVPDAFLENAGMSKRMRGVLAGSGGGSDVGAVKTFTQLGTMARRAAGADHAGVDVVDALRRVNSTSMVPRNAGKAGYETDDEEEMDNDGNTVPGFRTPPLDWGMKASMRVTSLSPASFAWAVSMHSRVEAEAVRQFASASPSEDNPSADCGAPVVERGDRGGNGGGGAHTSSSGGIATPDAHAMQAFRAATMSWIHPAEQFSGSVLAAMHNEAAPSGGFDTHLAARRQAWRRSFHSLFASLRAEKAPMFVVQCSECAAIFLSESYHKKGACVSVCCILISTSPVAPVRMLPSTVLRYSRC